MAVDQNVENEEPKRATRSEQKRHDVLTAAVKEFQADGFDRVSMDRIAESAGVSKRTVYNHFPSKELLFQAMVDVLASRCQQLQCEYCLDTPIEQQLLDIGERYAELVAAPDLVGFFRVVTARFLQRRDLAQPMLEEHRAMTASFVAWLKQGKKHKQLNFATPQDVADQFTALIDEFLFWPLLLWHQDAPSPRRRKQVVKSAVELILSRYATKSNTRKK